MPERDFLFMRANIFRLRSSTRRETGKRREAEEGKEISPGMDIKHVIYIWNINIAGRKSGKQAEWDFCIMKVSRCVRVERIHLDPLLFAFTGNIKYIRAISLRLLLLFSIAMKNKLEAQQKQSENIEISRAAYQTAKNRKINSNAESFCSRTHFLVFRQAFYSEHDLTAHGIFYLERWKSFFIIGDAISGR